MKRLTVLLVFVALAALTFQGCSEESDMPRGDEVTFVVYQNVKALQNEDLEAVIATIHPASPMYAATKAMAKVLFDQYDFDYELKDVKIISKGDEEAKVECVQITRKSKGPTFRDNQVLLVHTLKKYKGKWKLFSTEAKKIDYLN